MIALFAKELRQHRWGLLALWVIGIGLPVSCWRAVGSARAHYGPGFPPADLGLERLLLVWLLALVALLFLPLFAGEREKDTEVVLYTRPLPRSQVWQVKLAAAFLRLALVLALPLLLAGLLLPLPWPPEVFVLGGLLLALGVACVATFASSLAESSYAAAIYTFFGCLLYLGMLFRLAYWAEDLGGHLTGSITVILLALLLLSGPACLLGSYLMTTTAVATPWRRAGVVLGGWFGASLLGAGLAVLLLVLW